MAEILLKIRPGSGYVDGDVLCAFTDRHIRCVHAEHICHPQHAGFTRDGIRPAGLSERFLDCVYQYRFERLNRTQVKRVETDVLGQVIAEDVFGPESIDVAVFVARRLKHPKHRIFGKAGREAWHGGRTDVSLSAVNKSWELIQAHSDHRDRNPCPFCGEDHLLWPMGRLDIRVHLPVQTVGFTDEEAAALVSPVIELDDNGEPIVDESGSPKHKAKRKFKVDWRRELLGPLGLIEADVLDPKKPIGREKQLKKKISYTVNEHAKQAGRERIIDKQRGRNLDPD